MGEFLAQNWGSLLTGGILLCCVIFAVISIVKNKGKHGCCGTNCNSCTGCNKENCTEKTKKR